MGKENALAVDSFSLSTEDYSLEEDSKPIYTVTFQDRIEARVTEIQRIVETGQPCNMHIRYKDEQVEAVCTLNGCWVCPITDRILCDKPDMKIIGYSEQE